MTTGADSMNSLNEEQHLLITLLEECAELQKVVSKALRFGLDDSWRDAEYTDSPRALIHKELNEVIAVAELLAERGTLPDLYITRALIEAKKAKVIDFGFAYARKEGALV
jgi:hypothetical protein